MYVERIPNRNSQSAILLRESYREGNKIKKRTLDNLVGLAGRQDQAARCVLREDAGRADKPDAGNRHVRFDERDVEAESWSNH